MFGFLKRIFGEDAVERSIHDEELDFARANAYERSLLEQLYKEHPEQFQQRTTSDGEPYMVYVDAPVHNPFLCDDCINGTSHDKTAPLISPWVRRAQENDLPTHDTTNGADAYRTTRRSDKPW